MNESKEAISGTVTGNDQHVGLRAMIMKQAIECNLAGFAKNLPNDVVSFTLQGDAKRLTHAVSAIREGTRKSSDEGRSGPYRFHNLCPDIDDPRHHQPV